MRRRAAIVVGILCGLGTWVVILVALRAAWSLTGFSAFGTIAVWISHLSIFGWLLAAGLMFGWYKVLVAYKR
jgi:hypothetical protein